MDFTIFFLISQVVFDGLNFVKREFKLDLVIL